MSTDPKIAALEAELATTRAQLSATIDELSTRLDPRYQATQAAASGRRLVRDAIGSAPDANPSARTRARLVLGAGIAGLVVIVGAVARRR
jgi:phage-related tail protein